MTDKQIIIDDQKKTIHRLQDECTEKTNAIIALAEQLKRKEQEIKKLKNDYLQEIGQLKFAIGEHSAKILHLEELLDMRIEAVCDGCMADSMLPIKCKIYKQRLLEIKQILTEGVCKNCSEDSVNDCIPECDSHRILEIIKEVEDGR
ncbi:MAG: hypothetical protein J6V44_09165 [Methanobrevibacter sp.]|nr:hypothetical protein [Methanobrevibacter sp.]